MIKKITLVFALLASIFNFGQTPGGISNITVEYWLKADELLPILPEDGAEVKLWNDVSGNNRHFILPSNVKYGPEFIKSAINFHSAVDFSFISEEDNLSGPTKKENRQRKLQSVSTMSINSNRSYYVIWVSRFDNENSDENATVLTLDGNVKTDNFGWFKDKDDSKLFMDIKGSKTLVSQIISEGYCIGIAMIPNKGSKGLLPELLYNGNISTASKGGELSNQFLSQSVIGNSMLGASDSGAFFGEIAEIIVLSRPAGTAGALLSTEEITKINSYLSLKYGIGIDSNDQKQYVLSDGTIIYDGKMPGYKNYNNHIFGVLRDDTSEIYQKQSKSSSKVSMTVSLGDVEELNVKNQNEIPDKSALLFGGNDATGFTNYTYTTGTVFQNYTFKTETDANTGVVSQDRLSSRENYILRAKTTGQDSFTVNISPELGEWLLVGEDPSFTPANTRIYKIKSGQINNVVVNDGDYIGFAFDLKAPGGVIDGLKMWLNASATNTIHTNALGEVESWRDYAGLGTIYKKYAPNKASALYVKADERTNFHPTLEFRKDTDYLVTDKGPMSVAAPANVAIYTVINHNFATSRSYFIGFGAQKTKADARRPSFGVYRDKDAGKGRIGSTSLTNSEGRLFEPGATTIAGYHWNLGSTITFEFDAHREIKAHTAKKSLMNGPGMLGLASSSDSYYLQGVMPEVIAYERVLTKQERDKINSYLGLKYGITIDLDKNSNLVNFEYLFSDGTRIWEGNDRIHNNYHNNVASVIRDDNANLKNLQSRSTDVGAIVHMGVGSKLGIEPILDQINNDKSSITWGHNKGSLGLHSFVGNDEVCGEMDSRLNGRIWLVDKENFDQDILLAAHGPNFPFNGPGYQVFLLLADSAEKLNANKWDRIIPMAYTDDMHAVNYKFQDEFTYFTFGAKLVGSCEGCAFEGLKRLDFTKKNWQPKGDKGPKIFDLGDDFRVKVTVVDPDSNLRNKYPRASSLKSLREKRKGANTVTTKIEFTTGQGESAAASASFELFDIDRTGKMTDNVKVIGYCNGSIIYPKLSYSYKKPSRSRYTIDHSGNAKAKPKGESYSGNSGYRNRRGRVFVDFENPVQEIHVIYNTQSSSSSYSNSFIGIGAMELYCPMPLPIPNEDGLIFLKQGTSDVLLCEIVDYKFRTINTNCDSREIVFTDTLPEGMIWVNDSFTAENTEFDDSDISGYGTRTLKVKGMMIPGGASVYTFRASAIFEENAVAGTYKNKGEIEYDHLGSTHKIESIDRLTGQEYTETVAHDSERPKQVITSMDTDKDCFTLDKEIEVTLKINNPNNFTMQEMFLSFDFDNSAFTLVKNSLKTSPGLNLGSNQGEDGDIEYEDFKLPSGESWVKFRLKASNNINDYDVDATTGDPVSITLAYELLSEGEDECLEGALINANGELELAYCSICYYPKVVGNNGDIKNSNGYMAISSLNRANDDWVSDRGNAFVVLESFNKGLVVTRLTTAEINSLKPVEGMIVYDSTVNCLKIYNGNTWGCIVQGCVDQ